MSNETVLITLQEVQELENLVASGDNQLEDNSKLSEIHPIAEDAYLSTEEFLEDSDSRLKNPEKPKLDNSELSIEKRIAAMEIATTKYQKDRENYKENFDQVLNSRVESKFSEFFQKAEEEAEKFNQDQKSIGLEQKNIDKMRETVTNVWKANVIDDTMYQKELAEITAREQDLFEREDFLKLLNKEVNQGKTKENTAQLIQIGRWHQSWRIAREMENTNSFKGYIEKQNGNQIKGLNDILSEAKNKGLIYEKPKMEYDPMKRRMMPVEGKTTLKSVFPQAKIIIDKYHDQKEILRKKIEAKKQEEAKIEKLGKNGWIQINPKAAVKIELIRNNGKSYWEITDVMGQTEFKPGKYRSIPSWLSGKIKEKEEAQKQVSTAQNAENRVK